MIHDAQNLFSDAQAITSAAASTNAIDTGPLGAQNQVTTANTDRDIGQGQPLHIGITIDVAFTDAGSDSTLTVALEGDSTTTFTPDGTQDLLTIPALTAAGSKFFVTLDPGSAPLQFQFIRLLYTPNNGDLTTGSVTSFLIADVDAYRAYVNNSLISG